MKIKPLKLSLCAILGIAIMAPVHAQDEVIEEVIVTATKREQTLQEVPVAVSVTDSETIERAQILDIKDLQTVVPSLRVTQLQSSANTNFVIRGFGNGANNAGIEPSVGVFIDGVYRSRSASAISDLPNLERVEVLRGPQSTLFGKNASAGVISIITSKPSQDFGGSAELTVGNFGQIVAKGLVEGGISSNLAGSVSGSINQRDGYFLNTVEGNELNERDRYSARGQLLWTPTETSEFRLIADHNSFEENCCGVTNIIAGPAAGVIRLIGGDIASPNDPFSYEYAVNSPSINSFEGNGLSLQADFKGEKFDVTSITSYRSQNLDTNQDSDFSSATLIATNSLDQDIDNFTQEFRISNADVSGNLDWLLGAFIYKEDVDLVNNIRYGTSSRPYFNTLVGGALDGAEQFLGQAPGSFFAAGQGATEFSKQDAQATSLFGQIDWHLTDVLTATLGLSHTRDEKEVNLTQNNNDIFNSIDLSNAADIFLVNNFGTSDREVLTDNGLGNFVAFADATGAQLAGLSAIQFLPQLLNFPNNVEDGKSKDSATTYTARLAYDLNDTTNLYFSFATGFKATSWNLSRDSRPFITTQEDIAASGNVPANLTFGTRFAGPEDSLVFEVGLKKKFDRGAYNITLFNQEIEGFQSNTFTGTGFALTNAGKQSSLGLEFDSTYDATEDLTLTFATTLLDAEYDEFRGAAGVDGPTDLSGEDVSGIHPISATLGANYDFQLRNGWDGYVRGDYLFESNVRANDNTPESIKRQVNSLNASLGVETLNGWNLALWGRNITDDQYLLSSFPTVLQTGSFSGYPSQPRTYGLTIGKKF